MHKLLLGVSCTDMKTIIIVAVAIAIIIGGAYFFTTQSTFTKQSGEETEVTVTENTTPTPEVTENLEPKEEPEPPAVDTTRTVIGTSVEERPITAYHYGTGDREVLFLGGMHGGYSWNTALVAYELMEYLDKNPSAIPEGVKVTVIPVLNPDGLTKIAGTAERFEKSDVTGTTALREAARFNAHTVDLNRNFDCEWKASGTWQNKSVSGGTKAFSEPEAQALRDYVENNDITAAVIWYSAAGGVYASQCDGKTLPETTTLTNIFAKASGYKGYPTFSDYEVTGDATNWLSKEGVPTISVLLTTHDDTDWEKNKAGVDALLAHYAQ